MKSIFKKILCAKKTTKFERLKETGFFKNKYVEDKLMATWAEAANVHLTVADKVIESFEAAGSEIIVK